MSSGPAALLTPCRRSLRRAGRSLANPIPGTARVPCPSPFTLGGLRSPRGGSLLEAPMGALRSAAVSSDTPPAHPVPAATRSQGLAPLPATERRNYGGGPECGGLGALIFCEGAQNQRVVALGRADNRRIVSSPCLLPVRAANGEGDHPKPRRGEGWWRGARPRALLLPLHPRAEWRGGPPPHRLRRQGGDGRCPSTTLRVVPLPIADGEETRAACLRRPLCHSPASRSGSPP
jgi:hypothetical protein